MVYVHAKENNPYTFSTGMAIPKPPRISTNQKAASGRRGARTIRKSTDQGVAIAGSNKGELFCTIGPSNRRGCQVYNSTAITWWETAGSDEHSDWPGSLCRLSRLHSPSRERTVLQFAFGGPASFIFSSRKENSRPELYKFSLFHGCSRQIFFRNENK